jgi:hypothetical protein
MRKPILLLIAAAIGVTAGTLLDGGAQAAAIAPAGLREAADDLAVVETVQFVFGGHRYCWYVSGWRGAGWYRCGFRWRRGFGWGGPNGWRGWRPPGRPGINPPRPRPPGIHPPRPGRPGINPPRPNPPGGNRPGGNRPGRPRGSGNNT